MDSRGDRVIRAVAADLGDSTRRARGPTPPCFHAAFASRIFPHAVLQVLALPEHLDGTGVGDGIKLAAFITSSKSPFISLRPLNHHSFRILSRYSSELVEQVAALIVAAVSQIESINALGLRQLHVDLDYVANCCRLADSKLM